MRHLDAPVQRLAARRPAQDRDHLVHGGAYWLRCAAPSPYASPRPRQLALDVPSHAVGHGRDLVGDATFAARAKLLSIGRKNRQRRLEAMCQIGRSGARPSDGCLLCVEEVVDLGCERSHLVGESRSKPGLLTGAHGVKPSSHRIERPQADDHLRPGGREKKGGEKGERGHKIGRESTPGGMDLGSIDCDRNPNGAAAEAGGQRDRALDDKERGLARTSNRVLVHLGVHETVRG